MATLGLAQRNASRNAVYTVARQRAQAVCRVSRSAPCLRSPMRVSRTVVRAMHGAAQSVKEEQKNIGFVAEMRKVAMKLHTRDQAPKEGGKAASKTPMSAWQPTKEGYLGFLAQSKAVYDAVEEIVQTNPAYAEFRNSGLERGQALAADLEWFKSEYGLEPEPVTADSAAGVYIAHLQKLATEDPPAFICHYYNFYFAHTAGGRMIGSKVSSMILDNKVLNFYQWEGDVTEYLEAVRAKINKTAESWDAAQKEHCLAETADSFKYSGALMRSLMTAAH